MNQHLLDIQIMCEWFHRPCHSRAFLPLGRIDSDDIHSIGIQFIHEYLPDMIYRFFIPRIWSEWSVCSAYRPSLTSRYWDDTAADTSNTKLSNILNLLIVDVPIPWYSVIACRCASDQVCGYHTLSIIRVRNSEYKEEQASLDEHASHTLWG